MATSESEGQVISCHTVEAWTDQFQKGKNSNMLIVIDFTASWCGPCRFIAPFFAELAKKFPHVTFLKVDVDELKTPNHMIMKEETMSQKPFVTSVGMSVASDWKVEAMPTFIFLKEGNELDRIIGAKKEELQQTIAKHTSTATATA